MKQALIGLTLAWFVVTYSGQKVAGPFSLLTDCMDLAKIMASRYYNVSEICRAG